MYPIDVVEDAIISFYKEINVNGEKPTHLLSLSYINR